MKYYTIIVAGGKGMRMQTQLPKQFLLLNNEPVLMHTIRAFSQAKFQPKIILVLAEEAFDIWKNLCVQHHFDIPHQLVAGGSERFFSVLQGINQLNTVDSIIAVHDAVRPLVSQSLIDLCYQTAIEKGNAIPAVKPSDTIRQLAGNSSKIINRDEILLVQTPQVFIGSQLTQAYQQTYCANFTDDASVVEAAGFELNIVEGERRNLKITYSDDFKIAEYWMKEIH